MDDFKLGRSVSGRLVLTTAEGRAHEGVVVVRAFPIGAPDEGFALVSAEGRELAWFDRLDDLAPEVRGLVEEELAGREFMPVIQQLHRVSSFATPSTWDVETDRGETSLVLGGEEDIRRLGRDALLIEDIHGIHYLIRDLGKLDRTSRKLLDRFL
jgi:hypothetical protein